ncbi:CDP-alcohol phosphatidyltransferase family protein [Chloroflexota bacterium]
MSDSNQPIETNYGKPGASHSAVRRENQKPTILFFMKDIPNLVTLLGLSSGVLGIYLALVENFPAAVIAMLWAVLFDWYDGTVARRIPGRSSVFKSVGAKMDSLVDIVSLAVCPAIILLSYGEFSPWFFPGALVIIMAGVVRLAYFDIFGVDKDGIIVGLSLDITPLVVALVFLLESVLNRGAFTVLLYTAIVALSFLHVAPFRMHKMVGRWYHVITAYVLILTATYSFMLWAN